MKMEGGGYDEYWYDDDEVQNNNPSLCKQSWLRLKHNDPNLKSLHVKWNDPSIATINWRDEIHFLGTNGHLKRLILSYLMLSPNNRNDGKENLISFCKGLAHNKAIEHLILL